MSVLDAQKVIGEKVIVDTHAEEVCTDFAFQLTDPS